MAATKIVRTSIGGVEVKLGDGEYLQYKIVAAGAVPSFNLSCSHRTLWKAETFVGHPKQVYDERWPRHPFDVDANEDDYTVGFGFVAAVRYTLTVEHRRKDDSRIRLLKDVDFESNQAEADAFDGLTVEVSR
jgi:hypothetical protein